MEHLGHFHKVSVSGSPIRERHDENTARVRRQVRSEGLRPSSRKTLVIRKKQITPMEKERLEHNNEGLVHRVLPSDLLGGFK